MEWLKKLSDAIDYIERHLDSEISYEEAARIACCSPSYFQRMFSYVAGITLSDYIRRRKMTQAAFELQSSGKRVLDIALKYGYTSPTAFNRAFQSVHGLAPAAAKNPGCILHSYPPIHLAVTVAGDIPLAYRVEKRESMRFAGFRTALTCDMEENRRTAPAFWNEIRQGKSFSTLCELSGREPHGLAGITAYPEFGGNFYYIAASTGQPVPDGMCELLIPSATWVIFEGDGPFRTAVQEIFRRFLTEWLPFSGYAWAQLPDIEIYPARTDQPQSGRFEVWIALRKEKTY